MGNIKPDHIQRILINPFYAIQFAPQLVEEHVPPMSDEEWIQANISLIQEMGAEQWLTQLLDVLQGNAVVAEGRINPFNAATIDPMFALEHPSLVTKAQWVQANVALIKEMGAEQWLMQLLDVLEGDIVTAEDMGLASPPVAGRPRFRLRGQKRKKRRKHKK